MAYGKAGHNLKVRAQSFADREKAKRVEQLLNQPEYLEKFKREYARKIANIVLYGTEEPGELKDGLR